MNVIEKIIKRVRDKNDWALDQTHQNPDGYIDGYSDACCEILHDIHRIVGDKKWEKIREKQSTLPPLVERRKWNAFRAIIGKVGQGKARF